MRNKINIWKSSTWNNLNFQNHLQWKRCLCCIFLIYFHYEGFNLNHLKFDQLSSRRNHRIRFILWNFIFFECFFKPEFKHYIVQFISRDLILYRYIFKKNRFLPSRVFINRLGFVISSPDSWFQGNIMQKFEKNRDHVNFLTLKNVRNFY